MRARILARHRQGETLCVFVRGQHGSTSAVQSVETRGEADKQPGQRKFLPSLVSWPLSSQGVLGTKRGIIREKKKPKHTLSYIHCFKCI